MANIKRVRVTWNGFPGGPGVSTFYCLDTDTFLPKLRALYFDQQPFLPTTCTIQVEAFGDVIDASSGALVGAWTAAAVTPVVGTGTGAYAAPAGSCYSWLTDTVLTSKRLRGRTFMVPLVNTAFQSDGSLSTTYVTNSTAAALTFVTGTLSNFVIWSRPVLAVVGDHPVSPRTGATGFVTGVKITDKAAILTSRRD